MTESLGDPEAAAFSAEPVKKDPRVNKYIRPRSDERAARRDAIPGEAPRVDLRDGSSRTSGYGAANESRSLETGMPEEE